MLTNQVREIKYDISQLNLKLLSNSPKHYFSLNKLIRFHLSSCFRVRFCREHFEHAAEHLLSHVVVGKVGH